MRWSWTPIPSFTPRYRRYREPAVRSQSLPKGPAAFRLRAVTSFPIRRRPERSDGNRQPHQRCASLSIPEQRRHAPRQVGNNVLGSAAASCASADINGDQRPDLLPGTDGTSPSVQAHSDCRSCARTLVNQPTFEAMETLKFSHRCFVDAPVLEIGIQCYLPRALHIHSAVAEMTGVHRQELTGF